MTTPPTALLRWVLLMAGGVGVLVAVARPVTAQVSYLLPALTFGLVGWLLTRRRPDNAEGWVFLTAWAAFGVFSLAGLAEAEAVARGAETTAWAWTGAWLVNWLWPVLLVVSTTFPLLLFPSGFASPRWRWVGVAAGVSAGLAALCGMLAPTLSFDGSTVTVGNPLSPGLLAGAGPSDAWPVRNVALLGVAVTAVLAAVSVVLGARRADGLERLQFRWVAFAVAVMAVLLALLATPVAWLSDTTVVGTVAWAVTLSLLPAAMGLAILRYRLYDIDRIMSRTTSYALVTGLVLAVYALVVTAVTRLLPGTSSAFGVALATLAAAALFRPALTRVQSVVDRRFNRARYDAQRELDGFAGRLRDEVDPDRVVDDLLTAVGVTLRPARASVWLSGTPR